MKTKPRVLLLSATSGAGMCAPRSARKGVLARGDCLVEHIDALQYVSKLFQRIYDKAYISMVRRAPELMGVLYDRTDQPWHHSRHADARQVFLRLIDGDIVAVYRSHSHIACTSYPSRRCVVARRNFAGNQPRDDSAGRNCVATQSPARMRSAAEH